MLYGLIASLLLNAILGWRLYRATRFPVLASYPPKPETAASGSGAIPPNRYMVVRLPSRQIVYGGCLPGLARKTWEHTHPPAGESVEFWELGQCRGRKEA